MINFDLVQIAPDSFCYDFNLNGSCDEGEKITMSAGLSEIDRKQAVIDSIVTRFETDSNDCFNHTKNKSSSYDFVLGKTVDVRFFSTWEEYKNVGKTEALFGPESKRGLSSEEVVRLRQELVTQLNLQITQLDSLVENQRLDPQHPLAQLVHDLKILRPILEKVRIEIVDLFYTSASGQLGLIALDDVLSREAAYDPQAHVLELAEADRSDDFTQEKAYKDLADYLLPSVVHELDHAAMLTEGYVDDWTEHQYEYVSTDGSSCKTQLRDDSSAKFREDPATKVSLDFGLDFFSSDHPKVFRFDSVTWHYSAYPIYLGEKPVCVPPAFWESRKSSEAHAFQNEARLLLGMNKDSFGLTAQDMEILFGENGEPNTKREQLRNQLVQKIETQQWNYKDDYESVLLYYLAAGENVVSHGKGQDLEDYYNSYYSQPAPNPEGCFEPQLPE